MPAEPLTMSLADLAQVFHRTAETTSRHVAKLEGFPPPLPGRRPRLWSRAQVEAWLRDPQHAATHKLPANDAGALDPAFSPENVNAARARLAARYGASHA